MSAAEVVAILKALTETGLTAIQISKLLQEGEITEERVEQELAKTDAYLRGLIK